MEKRIDSHTAAYIDLAINVSRVFGMAAGVQALYEQRVPPTVVQRALINRGPRRGAISAWPEPSPAAVAGEPTDQIAAAQYNSSFLY
jgi:hypothetical protein